MSKQQNDFLLLSELGEACSYEVQSIIHDWLDVVSRDSIITEATGAHFRILMTIAIAELSDEVYAVIKKYQKEQNHATTKSSH